MNEDLEPETDDWGDWDIPETPKTICCRCSKLDDTIETILPGEPGKADTYPGLMCYDCAIKSGYCFGCGVFSAGSPAFDYGTMKGYCEHCQDEIKHTVCENDFDDYDDDSYHAVTQLYP